MIGAGTRTLRRNALAAMAAALAMTTLVGVATPEGRTQQREVVAAVDSALTSLRDGVVRIIVQRHGSPEAPAPRPDPARTAVERAGGTVTRDLEIVNGFAATVPADAIPALAATPGVRAISLDRTMRVQASTTTSPSNVKSVYRKSVKADDLNAAGITGKGVTVALIDTGVTEVPDLAGRLVTVTDDLTGATAKCQNLSNEPSCDDSYGHGTFVAGIIAGDGTSSAGAWKGVAPAANVLSVKIAGRNGAADVSSVLAAIQWVVSFRERYGIRVLNLSLGTDSTQSYRVDPLNFAVERAWAAGITVVVSASNRGPDPRTISKPGDDPFVITVGAVDDRGTSGLGDDTLPNFSSRGPTAADGLAKPDVVAPGAHMISLRAPGSAVDTHFPNYIDGSYRKGSGTSFSAAVVSGTAALLTQANPAVTPDRVKFALMSTARQVASTDVMAVGRGEIDAAAATKAPAGVANVGVERSNGTGAIDASRGTVHVRADDALGTVVSGALTLQLLLYDPIAFTTGDWTAGDWYGGRWYGGRWYGGRWYGSDWEGGRWYGDSWFGELDGGRWYGGRWYGSAWYGAWE